MLRQGPHELFNRFVEVLIGCLVPDCFAKFRMRSTHAMTHHALCVVLCGALRWYCCSMILTLSLSLSCSLSLSKVNTMLCALCCVLCAVFHQICILDYSTNIT